MVSAFNVDLAADNTNSNGYYINMYMHIYMHFYVISVFNFFFLWWKPIGVHRYMYYKQCVLFLFGGFSFIQITFVIKQFFFFFYFFKFLPRQQRVWKKKFCFIYTLHMHIKNHLMHIINFPGLSGWTVFRAMPECPIFARIAKHHICVIWRYYDYTELLLD